MCAYSPNRVLATLASGKSYATFAQEMDAKGLRVVRELMRDLDGNAVYVIEADDTENDVVEQMTMSIESTGSCSMVRPDHIYEANVIPNDTNYADQWGLEKIGAPQAWDTRTDASSVLVAVLDTGINYNHFDLNQSLWMNDGEIPGDGLDNDDNGIVDDIYGMSSIGGNVSGDSMDDNGHGSHCAGIIGAGGNNRRCIAGVAWRARIMGLKFLDEDGRGSVSDAITCLRYAEDHGARIVNCSFGSTDWDDYLYVQIKKMSQKGTIFACAAGNASPGTSPRDNDEYPFYPCNYLVDTLVGVAATDSSDALANFSYYGAQNVDIAAPGVDICSTVLSSSGLGYKSGTSMATPHVTGALALLAAHYPDETSAQIIDRLYAAAEPVPTLAGKVRTGSRLSMAGFFGITPPTEISVSQGTVNDAVVIYWAAVANGTHYRVWRAASEGGEKTMLCDWRQGLTYSDETAEPGVTNWYFLQAAISANGDLASTYSEGVSGYRPVIDTSRITVSFNPAGGAVSPASKVYRVGETYAEMPTPAHSGKAFLGWFTEADGGTRLDEPSLVRADATTLYAHWIDSDVLRVENLFARQRYPWNGYVDVSFDLYGVPEDDTASVSLTAQEEGGNAPLALRTFVGPAPTNLVNGAQHVVWNATPDTQGILYTNMILAATVVIDEKPLLPPKNVAASNATDADAVVVTWSASENATSYEVWRATANNVASATRIASPTATSYRDTTAVPATTYWYWVKAVNSKKTSEFSASASGSRKKIVTGIAISGSSSVTAGNTATYTCTATYNENTTATVTPSWSITSGSSYASITSSGVLTANGTATSRSVTIKASYSYNGSTQTMTKNVTINTKSVTISFNANGGSVSPTSQNYTAYGTYGSLPTPTRSNYSFLGWFTASSGGTQVTTTSTVPSAGTTLWAHWQQMTYTVTLDMQSGSGGSSSVTATYGSAMPSITLPTRTGYAFGGYYTSTGGGGTQYYTASGASARMWDRTAATTLYAKWTPNTYTIRFNANGGTGTMSDLAMTYDTAKNLASNVYTRAGYAFAGWATSSGGSVVYADGANVNNLTATQGAVVNLYAKWAAFSTILDTSAMSFTTGGDANWLVATNESYYGGSSARSGAIGHSKSTWLQGEITGAGLLSFWYKVSSESSCDKMTFYIDEVQKTSVSGTGNGWNQLEYSVTNNASHTFKWVYSKDGSAVRGEDCCWIDKVSWTQIVPPTGVTATQDRTDGIVISWTASVGATSYEIYRGPSNYGNWPQGSTKIGTSTTTSYTDTTAVGDTTYYYWVKAVGSSDFSYYAQGRRIITLTSVEIDGPDALMSECGGCYAAYANYSDGRRVSLSNSSTITISTNLYATLSTWGTENGVYYWTLTGKSVETRQSVTMTASYTYSGVTKTATKTISILPAGNLTYTYRTRPDGTAELTGYKGDKTVTELTLPSSINGLAVTRTSGSWMQNLSSLTRVTIPSSFTEVASSMFSYCYKLTSVTIPNSVRSIGSNAFRQCSSLQQMVIPSSVKTIGSYAFYYCTSLRQVVIPDSVTSIGSSAFDGCSSLTSITIPDSVVTIGERAFAGTHLTCLVIPDSVKFLHNACSGCQFLETIVLPEQLQSLDSGSDTWLYSSFAGCTRLETFEISANNPKYKVEDGVLFSKDGKTLIAYPSGKKERSYTVPSSVKEILHFAFRDCQNLVEVSFGAEMNKLNIYSFLNNPKLQTISAIDNKNYITIGGVLYNRNKTSLLFYPHGKVDKSYIMPDSIRGHFREHQTIPLFSTNLFNIVCSDSLMNLYLHDEPNVSIIKIPNRTSEMFVYRSYYGSAFENVAIPSSIQVLNISAVQNGLFFFGDLPEKDKYYGFNSCMCYYMAEANGWNTLETSNKSIWTNAVLALEIDGENKVFAGCSVPLYAKGSFESGHFGIASKADWLLATGSSYASINPSNGVLTANANVTTTRNISVYAYTTLGGAQAIANQYNVQIIPANTNTALIAIGKYAYNRLRWLPYPNAAKYNIRRGTNSTYSNASIIDTYLKETLDGTETFVDDTAAYGTTYYYWVEALDSNGNSLNVTDVASATRATGDLTYVRDVLTKLNNGTYNDSTFVTDAEMGILKEINYWKGVNSTWMTYVQNNSLSSITGANEMFWRSMYDLNTYIGVVMGMGAGPAIAGITAASSTSATITWNTKLGATSYYLYRGTSSNSSSASHYATMSGTSYTDSSISTGTQYYYWVKAVTPMGTTDFGEDGTFMRVAVSFNSNGGSVSPSSQTYTAYDAYGSLPTPTRTGYTFAGWWTASSGGTQVTTDSTVPASATTLYAHWTVNTYTVTLNQQSGSGGTASVKVTYGSAMPSITVPTRTGYTFGGYYTAENGSGTQYYTASGTSTRTWTIADATTLYAKWIGKKYTVTLNPNGGSGGASSVTVTYGSAMPSISIPTRSGYTFAGYYTCIDFSSINGSINGSIVWLVQYYNSAGQSARTWNVEGASTLYAKWNAN